MKYRVAFEDGREHEVEVREEADGLVVIVDGVAQPVELHLPEAGDALATVGDRPYAIKVSREGEKFTLELPGGRRIAGVEEEAVWALRQAASRRRQSGDKKRGEEVKSPIAGVILSLPAPEGSEVALGAPVAVIEAMKMENPIPAPRAGRVARLLVQVGETVKAGQPLAVIEEVAGAQ